MSQLSSSTRTFADRLREAVDATSASDRRVGRNRFRRPHRPALTPLANPERVRHSDALFVDRIRRALD
jgi:hypothetical protein